MDEGATAMSPVHSPTKPKASLSSSQSLRPHHLSITSPPATPPIPPSHVARTLSQDDGGFSTSSPLQRRDLPTSPGPTKIISTSVNTSPSKNNNNNKNTLSLLKHVEFTNRSMADEALGIARQGDREEDQLRATGAIYLKGENNNVSEEGNRGRFLSDMSEYDNWSEDPFYDVSPYTSDEDDSHDDADDVTKDKKKFSEEDRKFFRELDRENEREAKRKRKEERMKRKEEEQAKEALTRDDPPLLTEEKQKTIDRLHATPTKKQKQKLVNSNSPGGPQPPTSSTSKQLKHAPLNLAITDFSKQQRRIEKELLFDQEHTHKYALPLPDSTLQTYNPLNKSSQTPLFHVLPKPDSGRFRPKMLGKSTEWSPRHSNLEKVAMTLPQFSALNRAAYDNYNIAAMPQNYNAADNITIPVNATTTPIDFYDDAPYTTRLNPSKTVSASTNPLRQIVFEIDGFSTLSTKNMREFASLKDDVTTISFGSLPTAKTEATKITVLTPEMSQHAQIRNQGHIMGRGGNTFQPQDDANPKRSFFVFKFDDYITSDEKEVTEMEVVRNAVIKRGKKTFRGRVVVNIDGSDLNVIQKKLGYNLHDLTPIARHTFLKVSERKMLLVFELYPINMSRSRP